jgi:predicted transposase YdaD
MNTRATLPVATLTKAGADGRAEGRVEGRQAGKTEGQVEIILKLLELRFGPLPEAIQSGVRAASGSRLEAMAERVLTARTLEEALG